MAVFDADNCGDSYATADITSGGWASHTNCSISAGGGRNGGNAIVCQVSGATGRNLRRVINAAGSTQHLFHGFAYRNAMAFGYDVVSLLDANAVTHLTLGIDAASGIMTVYRGTTAGTALGVCSVALNANQYYFIEVEFFVDDTAGVARVWVDDVLVLDYSVAGGVTTPDTRNAGLASWSQVNYINQGANHPGVDIRYDDMYWGDDTGAAPLNTRLSDVSVLAHFPNGVGNSASWTRGGVDSGQNWSQMDEASANGDTDYVAATTAATKDLYTFEDLKAPGHTILTVQSVIQARKVDAGTATLGCVFRQGATDYPPASGVALGLTHRFTPQFFPLNPATLAAWIETDFNALQAGPYKNS